MKLKKVSLTLLQQGLAFDTHKILAQCIAVKFSMVMVIGSKSQMT